jgi:hypothetical protein
MNAEILSQLKSRLQAQPRSLEELHQAAQAVGSGWAQEQVGLLLDCLPEVVRDGALYRIGSQQQVDPLVDALLAVVIDRPLPAAALLSRLPKGAVTTAAGLYEAARRHPELFDIIPPNRIQRRA